MGMKRTIFTALTAAALLGAGVSFAGTSSTPVNAATSTQQSNDTGKVLINYIPGYAIAVWNSPNSSNQHVTGKFLKHGTQVNYTATDRNSNNGIVWYQIGKNQWIKSAYIAPFGSLAKTNVRSLTVTYVPGYSIAVWNSPLNSRKALAKKLKNGSTWKTYSAAQVGQDLWYNLGGNQWVNVHYITLNDTK
ncbi:SLAP domain-containing protein [Lacticaseibacillus saniviri]|uniref:S-layer protein C-terminal domain-containing protein n=1 Tax=Lacticaseibacillus saniviri JCM 17471 = DSM 24301 TaxID=1293598 RepID=A0A0R2MQY7_9LACO|nr:SLAP domain-containing protein [Lacticaseibacillus saniviri]KRO15148.1 hypothetical protein IV56_GL000239 [Lacticaseibacillus saniviri JCM 17471 = DSM 24301]